MLKVLIREHENQNEIKMGWVQYHHEKHRLESGPGSVGLVWQQVGRMAG